MVNFLRRGIQKVNQLRVRAIGAWINRIRRKPIWYTDQFGIRNQIRPHENIAYILSTRSHYDDVGVIYALQAILKPGMTVFDVGANKGDFTLHAAKLVAPSGHVHVFEPVKYTFDYLKENLQATSSLATLVTLQRLAVYTHNTNVTINTFPPELSGWNTMGTPRMTSSDGLQAPIASEDVEAVSLDSYCEQHGIDTIDLLKIDVEGFEVEVLEGAARLIRQRRVRQIIFEISVAPLEGIGRKGVDVLRAFEACGLSLYLIEPSGTRSLIRDVNNFAIPFFANYLATPT